MTFQRIGYLLLAAFVTAAVPGAPASAEAPGSLLLSYNLWEGGLHALSFETRVNRDERAYSVRLSARTEGLVRLFYPYSLKAQTEGVADESGLRPRHFQSTTKKRGKKRRQEITYLEDGSLDVRVEPTKAGRDRVPESLTAGTLDPASAVFSIIEAFTRLGHCDGSIPVYDGRRRYDLLVSQLGSRTLSASDYGMYSGPATLCRVAVEPLAGFKNKKRRKGRFPSTIDVWLAPAASDAFSVPVRLEGETNRGHMVLHLVEAEQRQRIERAAR